MVKMWDGKQPNPVWQQNVGAKVCGTGVLGILGANVHQFLCTSATSHLFIECYNLLLFVYFVIYTQICKAAFHDCFLGICDTFRDCLVLNVPRVLQQGQASFAPTTPSAAAAATIPVVTKAGSQYQKMQTRSIAFFPDDASQSPGAVIGSVEGRCSIVYIKEEHKQVLKP